MSGKAMSLKAKIRNLAKEKGLPAQVILQNYMFERFLVRLSQSEFNDKFILKGGMLIAALIGIDNRATMDLDVTVKDFLLNIDTLSEAIHDICQIKIEDGVKFSLSGAIEIRDDDPYGGYRVSITADYGTISVPMQIDVTTGDVITPKEIQFPFKMNFSEGTISVLAYNIETVLAEKMETILRRGELNTRPRDFYDVYILSKTQPFELAVFVKALAQTSEHRETTHIFRDVQRRVADLCLSETLKSRWDKYKNDYEYAKAISYDDVMGEILKLLNE
ncbi:MAG: nucleotidyl transferase AbiEii/AbiGii toxin family protein [Anaerolineaceae bacterium]|nr:nucleotidyl transferase AbiEii/AbiGii toxin family protein [Anaerolineaceae bacterium]